MQYTPRSFMLVHSGTYTASDIFILAPSVKLGSADNYTPLNALANFLQSQGFPFHPATAEDAKLNENAIKNKIVVCTIHQAKGLERKVVVVSSASVGYFKYYDENRPRTSCPDVLYVAFTRASEQLILIGESWQDDHLPFLKKITVNAEGLTYLKFIDIKSCFSTYEDLNETNVKIYMCLI